MRLWWRLRRDVATADADCYNNFSHVADAAETQEAATAEDAFSAIVVAEVQSERVMLVADSWPRGIHSMSLLKRALLLNDKQAHC
jgi:hypothetical protein